MTRKELRAECINELKRIAEKYGDDTEMSHIQTDAAIEIFLMGCEPNIYKAYKGVKDACGGGFWYS